MNNRLLAPTTLLTISTLGLSSCTMNMPGPWFGDKPINGGKSIEEIVSHIEHRIPAPTGSISTPNYREVLSLYEDVIANVEDRERQYQVARRIAQLKTMAAEEDAATGGEDSYGVTASVWRELLVNDRAMEDEADIRYQMARAYDLAGDAPNMQSNLDAIIKNETRTDIKLEARFRRAEILFSESRHQLASEDYAIVAATEGQYQIHARYMLGWSLFKQGSVDLALMPLLDVLDATSSLESSELRTDTTRVLMIILDYLDGATTLSEVLRDRGTPSWEFDIYQALANWYLSKKRYQDSIKTWETFLTEHPQDKQAPIIALSVMETYKRATFMSELPGKRRAFIRKFDRTSEYYRHHGAEMFSLYSADLRRFLEEVISIDHAAAQIEKTTRAYLVAASWYQLWLENFQGTDGEDEKRFLLAESLSDANRPDLAITEYTMLLDLFPESSFRREAAYAIVLELEKDETGDATTNKIEANLQFATLFPDDHRAAATQLRASKLQFDTRQYLRAVDTAKRALDLGLDKDAAMLDTAMTIIAHSLFSLHRYAEAVTAYRRLDSYFPDPQWRERVIIATYKQGEVAESNNDLEAAITHYSELQALAPDSDIAIDTSFDMVALYERMGKADEAIAQLRNFRDQHPDRAITKTISMRLVGLYETTNQPERAALELLGISKNLMETVDVRQQALYRAGELYISANNNDMAIRTFRDYAHGYPDPVDIRMEAMHQMDLLYQATEEPKKRRYWLRKKIELFNDTPDPAERIRYLAAQANFVLAKEQQVKFDKIALKLPIKKSLKKKRKAMSKTIAAYEQVLSYGVAEFVTAGNYAIGNLYQSLSQSLMAAETPAGLNDLEQSQYEILLEEQAYPFEEQAIDLHISNLHRGWAGEMDEWVVASLSELAILSPARFKRQEAEEGYVTDLY